VNQRTINDTSVFKMASRRSPLIIGSGLLILITASAAKGQPMCTGFALVALGATLSTVARYLAGLYVRSVVAVNLIVYASLYILLLGAVFDLGARTTRMELGFIWMLDLACSFALMAFVTGLCLRAILRQSHS
jgi:hypothetical protein